jgi:hypothetical protein
VASTRRWRRRRLHCASAAVWLKAAATAVVWIAGRKREAEGWLGLWREAEHGTTAWMIKV